MPPVFVTANELAERLDLSYPAVLELVRKGKIPHVRDGRNRLTFNLDSVIDALRPAPKSTRLVEDGKGVAR